MLLSGDLVARLGGASATVLDDFEDQDLAEWDAANWSIVTSPVYEGSYAASNSSQYDGLHYTGAETWGRGDDPLEYYFYISGTTTGNLTTAFAMDSTFDNGYELLLRYSGNFVIREMSSGSVVADNGGTGAEWRNGDWARLAIDFDSDGSGTIEATLEYQSDGASWTTSWSNTTYSTGEFRLLYPWSSFDGTVTADDIRIDPLASTGSSGGGSTDEPASYDVHEPFDDSTWTDTFYDIWTDNNDTDSIVDASGRAGNQINISVLSGEHYGMDAKHYHEDFTGSQPTECYHRFWLRIGSNFQNSITHDGKLPGYGGMDNPDTNEGSGGGDATGTGWSARMGWRHPDNYDTSQGWEPDYYVYHMDQDGSYGDHFLWDHQGSQIMLDYDTWYRVDQYINLGSYNTNDGILRGWIDGTKHFEKTDFRFRDSSGNDISRSWFNIYHGGGSSYPTDTFETYQDDFYIDRNGDGT